MGYFSHVTLLLLLLLCTSDSLALTVHHRCIFDHVSRFVGQQPPLVAPGRPPLPPRALPAKALSDDSLAPTTAASVMPAGGVDEAVDAQAAENGAFKTEMQLLGEDGWTPIRIALFSEDLETPRRFCVKKGDNVTLFSGIHYNCTEEDVLTDDKKATLVNDILPAAVKLHTDRLLVRPLTTPLVVPEFNFGGICQRMTVPEEHKSEGVSDSDMVLYVSAEPTYGNTFAWGVACATLSADGRPVVGAINYAPRFIALTPQRIRVAAHEMAHALGFTVEEMERRQAVETVTTLRGKRSSYVVKSSFTLRKAQLHYKCNEIKGMELEDKALFPQRRPQSEGARRQGPRGQSGRPARPGPPAPPGPPPPPAPPGGRTPSSVTPVAPRSAVVAAAPVDETVVVKKRMLQQVASAASHWNRRNAKDELMVGLVGAGYYTAITMAMFRDLGYYRVDFSKAEEMRWGKNAGCDFLDGKCVDNNTTKYPDMFCLTNESTRPLCTSDRQALGTCAIREHATDLPSQYQYFSDPKKGGVDGALMEFCPFIVAGANTGCADGNEAAMPGSYTGPTSRCVKGVGLKVGDKSIGDVCVDVRCGKGRSVSVRHKGSAEWQECTEGETLSVSGALVGGIVCPSYDDVCTAVLASQFAGENSAPHDPLPVIKGVTGFGTITADGYHCSTTIFAPLSVLAAVVLSVVVL